MSGDTMWWQVLLFLWLGALTALAVLIAHKVRRVHLKLFELGELVRREHLHTFRQVEALAGLYRELDPPAAIVGTRNWAASPDFLHVISRHALDGAPGAVIECSSGWSTVVLAHCMRLRGGGHVYSLEHEARFARDTRELLERHQLAAWATVLDAPLVPVDLDGATWSWYDLTGLPEVAASMLVVDGPPEETGPRARYPALPLLADRLVPGARVFLDDADRPDERWIVERWRACGVTDVSWRDCEKGCAILLLGAPAREEYSQGAKTSPESDSDVTL